MAKPGRRFWLLPFSLCRRSSGSSASPALGPLGGCRTGWIVTPNGRSPGHRAGKRQREYRLFPPTEVLCFRKEASVKSFARVERRPTMFRQFLFLSTVVLALFGVFGT